MAASEGRTHPFVEQLAQVIGIRTTRNNGDALATADLQAALMAAAAALKAKADSSTLATDEALADCVLRVKITPPPIRAVEEKGAEKQERKRPREHQEGAQAKRAKVIDNAAGSASVVEDAGVRVVKAHSQILARTSAYFLKALGGGWKERADKTIEIEVSDMEEFGELSRLVRLMYQPTYLAEDGEPLNKEVLVRLMLMADRFEVLGCINECATALGLGLTYDDAVMVLNSGIPDALAAHAMVRELLMKSGDVVAKGLGPVAQLFEQGETLVGEQSPSLRTMLNLKGEAKALSATALEFALRSDELVVTSENEPFLLLLVWVDQHDVSHEEAQALFNRLIPHMRYHHMSQCFLCNVVLTNKYVRACPEGITLIAPTLGERGPMQRALSAANGLEQPRRSANRSVTPCCNEWVVEGSISLEDCRKGDNYDKLVFFIGLADGFPVGIHLERHRRSKPEDDRVAIFMGFPLGYLAGVVRDPPTTCMACKVSWSVGKKKYVDDEWLVVNNTEPFNVYGWLDYLDEPWLEVMSEECRYISERRMPTKLTITLPTY